LVNYSLQLQRVSEQQVRYVAPPTIWCHAYRGTNHQLHSSKARYEPSYSRHHH